MVDWFSSIVKDGLELIMGLLSLRLFTETVMFWDEENDPSLAVTVAE